MRYGFADAGYRVLESRSRCRRRAARLRADGDGAPRSRRGLEGGARRRGSRLPTSATRGLPIAARRARRRSTHGPRGRGRGGGDRRGRRGLTSIARAGGRGNGPPRAPTACRGGRRRAASSPRATRRRRPGSRARLIGLARGAGWREPSIDSFDGPQPPPDLRALRCETSDRHEFLVDLAAPAEERFARLKASHRRKVRDAEASGVTVADETGRASLDLLCASCRARRRSGAPSAARRCGCPTATTTRGSPRPSSRAARGG